MKTTTPAVIYARLSLDKAGNGIKVQDQEDECRALAARLGLTVARVYVDNDLSATTGVRRPAFEALLHDKPEVVIVWHQDRLLRVSRDLERVLEAGCVVHQVTAGSLDLATPTGRAVARTVAAWSTYEGEHKAERQRAANRKRAMRGNKWWSRRPFGYELDTTIREHEAEALRAAFHAVLNGKSSYRIAQEWNQAGIAMPSSSGQWEGRRVTQLLRNPIYAGMSVYRGEVVGKGTWQPIVDEGTFYAVQGIVTDPKRRVGGAPRYSLLSGLLRCARCGNPMNRWRGTRPSGTTFDRYRCNGCQFMVDRRWAEDIAVKDHFDFLATAAAEVQDDADTGDDEEVTRLTARLDDLASAYAREAITLAQLEAGTTAIRERITAAQEHSAQAARRTHLASPEDIRANWDAMSVDEQRESMSRGGWSLVAFKDEDGTKHVVWVQEGEPVPMAPGARLGGRLTAFQPQGG